MNRAIVQRAINGGMLQRDDEDAMLSHAQSSKSILDLNGGFGCGTGPYDCLAFCIVKRAVEHLATCTAEAYRSCTLYLCVAFLLAIALAVYFSRRAVVHLSTHTATAKWSCTVRLCVAFILVFVIMSWQTCSRASFDLTGGSTL